MEKRELNTLITEYGVEFLNKETSFKIKKMDDLNKIMEKESPLSIAMYCTESKDFDGNRFDAFKDFVIFCKRSGSFIKFDFCGCGNAYLVSLKKENLKHAARRIIESEDLIESFEKWVSLRK